MSAPPTPVRDGMSLGPAELSVDCGPSPRLVVVVFGLSASTNNIHLSADASASGAVRLPLPKSL